MKEIWISIRAMVVFTVLCGLLYPALITGVAALFFPAKSKGSLLEVNGKVIGSSLLAQEFKQERYFWPRPSSVSYNPIPSGGSNLGPTSKVLFDRVEEAKKKGVEGELLYTSGSGLDPHISPKAALAQVRRVASARRLREIDLQTLVGKLTENQQFGFLGEPRVNVLNLNLALDRGE